jgi:hypothetical protein
MAVSTKPSAAWSRTHFVIRFLGLTGLAVALVGLALALITELLRPNWSSWSETWTNVQANLDAFQRIVTTQTLSRRAEWSIVLLAAGLVAGLFALIVEMIIVLRLAAGRRSAYGFNSAVQLALAIALVIGVNVFSFQHYQRYDWTSNQQFTLPADLQENLHKLQGETTIVVYVPHQSFGQKSQTLDPESARYVYAAERKVVDKLKDVVDQFREFGKQFRVVVLDVEDEQFQSKLDAETANAPDLADAIQKAPENTIFFTSQGKLQRLRFSDLFLLDKEASRQERNLVLLNQGVEPLARKVLAINEKRPTIGIAVIHEWLTTAGRKDLPFTMAGLKKSLTGRGFDVKDVVLKKWGGMGGPEPAVYSVEDSKLDRLESRLKNLDTNVRGLTSLLQNQEKAIKHWKSADLNVLTKEYAEDLGVKKVTPEIRSQIVTNLEGGAEELNQNLTELRKRHKEVLEEKNKLNLDSLAEQRRMSDLQAKLTRTLADCDLLIVPRWTLKNVVENEENIPFWLHRLEEGQAEVLRDFVKQGKPILVCFGPTNESGDRPPLPGSAGPDGVEKMLTELGIKFVNQTVLFDAESEAFSERGSGPFGSEVNVEVPSVDFDWKTGAGRIYRSTTSTVDKPNPIRHGMSLIARSFGRDAQGKSLLADLSLRAPQPVYYEPPAGTKLAFEPEFMMTSAASWNEAQPFPTAKGGPEPPKSSPKKGTIEEKRRGPFPIGVAVATKVPADWYTEKNAQPPTVRVAVIGHGGLFNGAELSPAKEILLLDTCNWLLGRDQELALKDTEWKYPRVELSRRDYAMWQWGAWLGLPALFAYLGLVVVLVRRLR